VDMSSGRDFVDDALNRQRFTPRPEPFATMGLPATRVAHSTSISNRPGASEISKTALPERRKDWLHIDRHMQNVDP